MKNLIHILVDDDLKKQLENESKQKGLSLCAYIRLILIERDK